MTMPAASEGFLVIDCSTGLAGAWAASTAAAFGLRVVRLSDGAAFRATLPDGAPAAAREAMAAVAHAASVEVVDARGSELEQRVEALAEAHAGRFALIEDRGGAFAEFAARLADRHDGYLLSFTDLSLEAEFAGWSLPEPLIGALSGHAGQSGLLRRPPLTLPCFVSEYVAGLFGVIGLFAALFQGRKEHRRVRTSRLEALATLHPFSLLAYSRLNIVKKRANPLFPRSSTYQCSDGEIVLAAIKPRHWESLCLVTGLPELLADSRFTTPMARALHHEELKAAFAPWFENKTRAEAAGACAESRIPFGVVRSPAEVRAEPFSERDFFAGGSGLPPAVLDNGLRPDGARCEPAAAKSNSGAITRDDRAPLAGVRVVEFTAAVAGPFAARILADLGADVVLLEPRGPEGYIEIAELGDRIGAFLPNLDSTEDPLYAAGARHQAARGKRSVLLDRDDDVRQCIRDADVFLQNFAPGVAAARGLGPEQVRALNPDIVYVSMSGFGQSGPYASLPAFAPTTEAEAGFDWFARYPDGRRGDDVLGLADYASGLEAVAATIARLLVAGPKTFHHLDVSQAEATMRLVGESLAAGEDVQRMAFPHTGVFPAVGSDEWVAICPVGDVAKARLDELIGAGAATDPDIAIARWTSSRTKFEAARELQANGIAAAPVLYTNELFADPYLNRKGAFIDLEDNSATTSTRYEALPIHFAGWSPAYAPGPHIGEANPPWMSLRHTRHAENSNVNPLEKRT